MQPFVYEVDEENIEMENRHGLLFVGGFHHTPNVDGIKWFLQNVYSKILAKRKDIPLVICGSNPSEELVKFIDNFKHELHTDNIVLTGYVKDEVLAEYYRHCRMVIAPLRFGAGVKGKVIEAMSFGSPVITTEYGSQGIYNYSQRTEDISGILISSLENFEEVLLQNYDDIMSLKMMSILNKEYIKKHYSKQTAIDFIKTIME
jgi:glycosyltransferase involved in cell wall biosynthesis